MIVPSEEVDGLGEFIFVSFISSSFWFCLIFASTCFLAEVMFEFK